MASVDKPACVDIARGATFAPISVTWRCIFVGGACGGSRLIDSIMANNQLTQKYLLSLPLLNYSCSLLEHQLHHHPPNSRSNSVWIKIAKECSGSVFDIIIMSVASAAPSIKEAPLGICSSTLGGQGPEINSNWPTTPQQLLKHNND